MTLNTSRDAIVARRRTEIARLRQQGLTQREIEAELPKLDPPCVQPDGKPFCVATINRDIAALREEWREKAAEVTDVTESYIVSSAKEVAERCMQRAPVMRYDRSTKEYVHEQDEEGRYVWRFDAQGAVASLTLLARSRGMLTDKSIVIPEDLARVLMDTKRIMSDVVADESIPRAGIMAEVDRQLLEEARRRGHQG